ncbi:hypothetical protein DFA_03708 [Cavenderia fasciculata]|uniref:Monalysin Pore-forming domain-containing protein n=1 Tax=Cavenderia fasciculata TaxID=261658 RepID=F4Q1S1_CACFS|nr:uncharacterized protein DFA_03708 [Cavenderia fasciculata]EGG18221.1 hypothetical protein DFA_03708 [Cavenderia fasciculata]|eukprot:XP_004357044.1 hypothetical protein DFA_03708 [Cavenderia fasciculata]
MTKKSQHLKSFHGNKFDLNKAVIEVTTGGVDKTIKTKEIPDPVCLIHYSFDRVEKSPCHFVYHSKEGHEHERLEVIGSLKMKPVAVYTTLLSSIDLDQRKKIRVTKLQGRDFYYDEDGKFNYIYMDPSACENTFDINTKYSYTKDKDTRLVSEKPHEMELGPGQYHIYQSVLLYAFVLEGIFRQDAIPLGFPTGKHGNVTYGFKALYRDDVFALAHNEKLYDPVHSTNLIQHLMGPAFSKWGH